MSILVDIRTDYDRPILRKKDLNADPIRQFETWFDEVLKLKLADPNAMTLATADKQGRPSARTVLLKGVDQNGFSFFTNYESRKGRELGENPNAALVFFWQPLARQVCVNGSIEKLSREESESYFQSRPRGSQLAAWVSRQTSIIEGREVLDKGLEEVTKKYEKVDKIPLPPYWGGFVLKPEWIEFWQGRPNRLHDRFRYRKDGKSWKIDRLSP